MSKNAAFGKALKIITGIIFIAFLLTLLYFANAFFGNPISAAIVKNNAKKYLSENHADTDFEIHKSGYNFKNGDYYAFIDSPSSQDSYFTIYFDTFGRYQYDTYANIENKGTIISRLDDQYRTLVDNSLPYGKNQFDISISYGELRIAGIYEVFSYTDENGTLQNYTIDKDYGLDRDSLVLDKDYDIQEIGKECGRIVLYIHDPVVSVERAAELLLEVKDYLDENKIPFHAISLSLCEPRNEQGQNVGNQITLHDFLYSDIYEEDLINLVQEHWDIAQEHHAIQDGLKNGIEKIPFNPVLPENTT